VAAPPEICPECGAEVPPRARACPSCGADEETGWSERAQNQRLGIPDDDFDHDEFVKAEFGSGERPLERVKPRGIRWVWWVVAVALLLALAYSFLHRLL
jgi:zinc ribbon protein